MPHPFTVTYKSDSIQNRNQNIFHQHSGSFTLIANLYGKRDFRNKSINVLVGHLTLYTIWAVVTMLLCITSTHLSKSYSGIIHKSHASSANFLWKCCPRLWIYSHHTSEMYLTNTRVQWQQQYLLRREDGYPYELQIRQNDSMWHFDWCATSYLRLPKRPICYFWRPFDQF